MTTTNTDHAIAIAALTAATDSLGEIMLSLGARKFLLAGVKNQIIQMALEERMRTDEQLATLAAKAFEAAVLVLVKLGVPGATAFTCNPSEEP